MGGMVIFKGGLNCKGRVNSVFINAITEKQIEVIIKYKYNVKTCTITALYQVIKHIQCQYLNSMSSIDIRYA